MVGATKKLGEQMRRISLRVVFQRLGPLLCHASCRFSSALEVECAGTTSPRLICKPGATINVYAVAGRTLQNRMRFIAHTQLCEKGPARD